MNPVPTIPARISARAWNIFVSTSMSSRAPSGGVRHVGALGDAGVEVLELARERLVVGVDDRDVVRRGRSGGCAGRRSDAASATATGTASSCTSSSNMKTICSRYSNVGSSWTHDRSARAPFAEPKRAVDRASLVPPVAGDDLGGQRLAEPFEHPVDDVEVVQHAAEEALAERTHHVLAAGADRLRDLLRLVRGASRRSGRAGTSAPRTMSPGSKYGSNSGSLTITLT